jgi:hypothetical protein
MFKNVDLVKYRKNALDVSILQNLIEKMENESKQERKTAADSVECAKVKDK